MATSMAAAIAASLPTPQAATPTPAAPTYEAIPASMAKVIDIEAEIPITSVQLDGLVVSKIVKHSRESPSANGLLLGLDLDGILEVSNSFPLPPPAADEEDKGKKSLARYQTSMLRCLKEVHADDSVVGFYQSTTSGAFLSQSLVERALAQHDSLRHGGVILVHDVSQTARGNAAFRAFRLTSAFLDANKKGKFNTQTLIDHRLTFSSILEEINVTIRNSPLLNAYLSTLTTPSSARPQNGLDSSLSAPTSSLPPSYSSLDLNLPNLLTRNLEQVLEAIDEYKVEENNLAYLSRQITREKQRADAHVQKRREENAMRVAQGLAPLPEDDVSRLFKIPPEPSRLESMLILGQMDGYAKSLENITSTGLVKMYAARSNTAT